MAWNDLQRAAFDGSAKLTAALLSKASIDINEPNDEGFTPLIMASQEGHHRIVAMLLENGARLSSTSDDKATALMMSAQNGHVIITKLLVDAGAELEASNRFGATALQLAADGGYIDVVKLLIRAGAKVDASDEFGNTSILCSAQYGHLAVVKALASAGANIASPNVPNETPLFAASVKGHLDIVKFLVNLHLSPKYANVSPRYGNREPLNGAARHGHTAVVRELLRLGVEACSGPTRGKAALAVAAMHGHVDIVVMLRAAGVTDDGDALVTAIEKSREASVKVLLRKEWAMPGANYVNDLDFVDSTPFFFTPLSHAVGVASPRIARMLLDAGADERLVSRVACVCVSGEVRDETPMMLTNRYLAGKILKEQPAGAEAMLRLEAVRRLLLRVDAIRAVSWLWPSDFPRIDRAAAKQSSDGTTRSKSTARKPVHIVRHRERVRRGILATLFR